MSTPLIIMGSSRSDGDTAGVVNTLASLSGAEVLDLASLSFSDYDYEARNLDDDFLPAVRRLLDKHQQLILASPVYWYTMSALMKRFLDRISDCLRVDKDTGRQFRGKHLAALSVSNDVQPPAWGTPFALSADYLGMHYLGDHHVAVDADGVLTTAEQLQALIKSLKNAD